MACMAFRKASQALQTFSCDLTHHIGGVAHLIQSINSFVKELNGDHTRSCEGFHASREFIFNGRWRRREAFSVVSRLREGPGGGGTSEATAALAIDLSQGVAQV